MIGLAPLVAAAAAGSAEAVRLFRPHPDNGHTGVYAYHDEHGAAKGLPRNPRAEALAAVCGIEGARFHGTRRFSLSLSLSLWGARPLCPPPFPQFWR